MQLARFIQLAYTLKSLKRAGWVRAGVSNPESVAAHSWGMALLVIQLAPPHIDIAKALKMALIHDLPEVIVGDITPHDGVSKQVKHAQEYEAAQRLFSDELLSLWLEYTRKESPEAQFVSHLDKLDMGFQAHIYSSDIDASEFMDSALRDLPPSYQDLLRSWEPNRE
ncbi:MAG: HD domain-containing protein [Myxococcota bacterium]|nr:HD domain-containing protein [Myxococcota bacterium]